MVEQSKKTNSQILSAIIEKVEQEHKNLYHDISKENLQSYISKIKNIDNLSPVEFDHEMLKLFALFKDSHTSYYVPWKSMDKKLMFLNNKFYVYHNDKYKEIISINGMTVEELYKKFVPLMNYETKEWLNAKIDRNINNRYFYEMLGIDIEQDLIIKTIDNEEIISKIVDEKSLQNNRRQRAYSYKIIDNEILIFRYRACREEPDYPFADFISDLTAKIEKHNVKKYVLDLRNNGGGNSEILNPFQTLVREKQLEGVLIIDNGVFSAGRFAVARFKKEFNSPLIGEPTGGAVKSYGNCPPLELEGKHFSASQKFFDFSDVVDYEGGFRPDIYVPTTVEDLNNHYDRPLSVALETLKNNEKEL